MTTKDLVLSHLRRERIKLWLPPYHDPLLPATQQGGRQPNGDALAVLAERLRENIIAASGSSTSLEVEKSNNRGCGDKNPHQPTADEIRGILLELRDHALQKLRRRSEDNSVDVRVLASGRHRAEMPAGAFSAWGDQVSVSSADPSATLPRGHGSGARLLVRVLGLSPDLTVGVFSSDLCRALDAKAVRVIWKGKNISLSASSSGKDASLRAIVLASGNSDGASGAALSHQKRKSELLCLVSGFGYAPPAPAAATPASPADAAAAGSDSSVVESIRRAARAVQASARGSRFEVTDQSGNLVSMSEGDSAAFLMALGLHRIGRSRMERWNAVGRDTPGEGKDSCTRDSVGSALVFLLEADAEWNGSPALNGWRSRVDNYGLLQLDITWCFLLLESLDSLDDAVRRLDIAERVLRSQVHVNFVTLALAQAEMGNPIPPLCTVFVRLFLLQGAASGAQGRHAAASEKLGWARLLCDRLRSCSSPESVDALCSAYLVDRPAAVAALRRSNGDPDAAGIFIAQDREEEGRAAGKRLRQHRIGRCANGVDFVNLDLVPTLSGMLGFDGVAGIVGDTMGNDGGDGAPYDDLPASASIVFGLLRLSDNDVNRCLELYNGVGAERVLERAARLDEASGRKKRRPGGHRQRGPAKFEVRDMDLTMLVSMGVKEARAREALEATGHVESALLWLSSHDATVGGDKSDAKTTEEATLANGSHVEDNADWPGVSNGSADDHSKSDNGGDILSGSERIETDDVHHLLEKELGNALSSNSSKGRKRSEIDDAHQLLERELGNVLSSNSNQLLEREWLGVDLQDEWDLIQKYTLSNASK